MTDLTFHLIPNAHLDPVWLWDWREGLNEGVITCRTILDLMDENKKLTFIRGETIIYEHIERTDPATFARIKKYVKAGRWDPVGGTVIQPDTNLPDTETFARHFLHGQQYLKSRFGKTARVAWAADSFGHAAGLPEILAASGIESFAFSRPAPDVVPIAQPAFWWEGPGGSRILAYRPPVGWYGCEREEMTKRLDAYLDAAMKSPLGSVGIFLGLGNHGGGPTRRHLEEIAAWAKRHWQVRVVFSGLHKFFDTLRREISKQPKDFLPVHRGELNFVLRGCYSSVAKFKFAYRKTENVLQRAEKTHSIISGTGASPVQQKMNLHGRGAHATGTALHQAWHGLLFNSFHDILPGSSIERAFDEQLAWIGGCQHAASEVEFAALNNLAAKIDTTVHVPKGDMPSGVALLVWNPHPHPFRGPIEIEASLDYRPIWKYHKNVDALPVRLTGPDGNDVPYQLIDTEHHSMTELAWRKRAVIDADLPAFGWNVLEMAYDESADIALIPTDVATKGNNEITNGVYAVRAVVGSTGIEITRHGKKIFDGDGLSAITVEDPWGSWGGMAEEKESLDLSTVRHQWKITDVHVLERGPLRAAMWVKLEAGNSRLELTLSCSHAREVRGRDRKTPLERTQRKTQTRPPRGRPRHLPGPRRNHRPRTQPRRNPRRSLGPHHWRSSNPRRRLRLRRPLQLRRRPRRLPHDSLPCVPLCRRRQNHVPPGALASRRRCRRAEIQIPPHRRRRSPPAAARAGIGTTADHAPRRPAPRQAGPLRLARRIIARIAARSRPQTRRRRQGAHPSHPGDARTRHATDIHARR